MNIASKIINLVEEGEVLTPAQAKKVVSDFLQSKGLNNKLKAKTIGFQDLARADMVFVQVLDWSPSPIAQELEDLARQKGFRVQFKGGGFVG